ncbi:MAG TPA: diaminopimelate decarboxylase [Chthoniobacterales bacterium]|nr:diaminopimelate decarboxylase [Chthoniobacterales bacterium]
MHAFHYRNHRLHCEEVDLTAPATDFGTPLFVYSAGTILDHYRRLDDALSPLDHLICYAVKANSNGAILKLLADAGAGFDIVSGGELYRVSASGGDPRKCTFAGVGKSREEIGYALDQKVLSFNVESEGELEYIEQIARGKGVRAPVALRINPDVDPHTHQYISTGSHQNKFGIALDRAAGIYQRASRMPNVELVGIQMHIGSQITDPRPFAAAVAKVVPLVKELKSNYDIKFFSIGGGLGIVYQSSLASGERKWWHEHTADSPGEDRALSIQEYVETILPALRELGVRILLEPGRLLVGNAGVLLTRVRYLKQTGTKSFAIVDAGMNDLIRPALYQSYHEIKPVEEPAENNKATQPIDVVGPVCESGDFFAIDRPMPILHQSDLLAIMSAGAYAMSMASNYNSRPLPAEVLVSGQRFCQVRRRQQWEDLIREEVADPIWSSGPM